MRGKILIGLLLTVLAKTSTVARGVPEFITSIAYSKAFTIEQNDWNAGFIELRIIDRQGTIIFNDKMSSEEISKKKFVTKGMTDGNYTIQWMDNLAFISQELKVENSLPVLNTRTYNVIYKPVVTQKENVVNIYLLTLSEEVNIRLYDPLGQKVFEETSSLKDSYQQTLNIVEPIKGDYILATEIKNQTFTNFINFKK